MISWMNVSKYLAFVEQLTFNNGLIIWFLSMISVVKEYEFLLKY